MSRETLFSTPKKKRPKHLLGRLKGDTHIHTYYVICIHCTHTRTHTQYQQPKCKYVSHRSLQVYSDFARSLDQIVFGVTRCTRILFIVAVLLRLGARSIQTAWSVRTKWSGRWGVLNHARANVPSCVCCCLCCRCCYTDCD
jgi:hypothetical protein